MLKVSVFTIFYIYNLGELVMPFVTSISRLLHQSAVCYMMLVYYSYPSFICAQI